MLESGSSSSSEDLRFALYHLIFIRFEARLRSYLSIRAFNSILHFHPSEFFLYRSLDLVELARRLAYREDVRALEILFRNHFFALEPYRLQILSSFPESTKPSLYESLLPGREELKNSLPNLVEVSISELERNGEKLTRVLKSLQLPGNLFDLQNDISLLLEGLQKLPIDSDFPLDELFLTSSSRKVSPDDEDYYTWFIRRAKDIDNRSGFLNNSVELLNLTSRLSLDSGAEQENNKHGRKRLKELKGDAETLYSLVYEYGLEDVSLEFYQKLSDAERIKLVLRGVTLKDVVERVNEVLIPLLDRLSATGKARAELFEAEAKALIYKWTHQNSAKRSDDDWLEVFSDVVRIRREAFNSIELRYCEEAFLDGLLSVGRFELARLLLKGKLGISLTLSFPEQEAVLLQCCRTAFDSATSFYDSHIQLAQQCLDLLPPEHIYQSSEETVRERNFLKGADTFATYGIPFVPAKLRATPKLEVVRLVMSSSSPAGTPYYKQLDKLMLMARQFSLSKDEQRQVRFEISHLALADKNVDLALQVCRELIKTDYKPAWEICLKIANSDKCVHLHLPLNTSISPFCHPQLH